jgi:DNA-binding NarL/FixJ family response regulator
MTGIEIAEACSRNDVKTKIILITFEKDQTLYDQAKSFNVSGYILKEFALVEIEHCIKAVNNGKSYFSEQLSEYLSSEKVPEILDSLTPTEKKVLYFIAQNKTAKEIGELMFVSFRTVEKHKSNIIKKLDLESKKTSLSLFAKENEQFLN